MKLAIGRSLAVAVVVSAVFLFGVDADAAVHPLSALLDGDAAGTGSPGTGSADVTYDDVTGLLSWDISWSGLTGSETLAHFHGPATPDQDAGIQVNIGAISGLVSPSIGSATISGSQADDLLDDLWYINIHTDMFPAGEIRGQVVPEPASAALLGGGLAMLSLRRRRRLAR